MEKTKKVTDMSCLFCECSSLITIDRHGRQSENVTDMSAVFYGCSSLTTVDLSKWNTEKAAKFIGSKI